MEITIFNVYSILLNDIDNFNMFHIYFIGFGCSSISISLWEPCRKVNNEKSGVRKVHAFYDPVPTYLSNQLLTYLDS